MLSSSAIRSYISSRIPNISRYSLFAVAGAVLTTSFYFLSRYVPMASHLRSPRPSTASIETQTDPVFFAAPDAGGSAPGASADVARCVSTPEIDPSGNPSASVSLFAAADASRGGCADGGSSATLRRRSVAPSLPLVVSPATSDAADAASPALPPAPPPTPVASLLLPPSSVPLSASIAAAPLSVSALTTVSAGGDAAPDGVEIISPSVVRTLVGAGGAAISLPCGSELVDFEAPSGGEEGVARRRTVRAAVGAVPSFFPQPSARRVVTEPAALGAQAPSGVGASAFLSSIYQSLPAVRVFFSSRRLGNS